MFERGNPYGRTDPTGHCVLGCVGDVIVLTASVVMLLIQLEAYNLKKQTEGVTTDDTFSVAAEAVLTVGGIFAQPAKGAEEVATLFDVGQTVGGIKGTKENLRYIEKTCGENPNLCPKNKEIITTDQFNKDIIGGSNYFNIDGGTSQADGTKTGNLNSLRRGGGGSGSGTSKVFSESKNQKAITSLTQASSNAHGQTAGAIIKKWRASQAKKYGKR